MTLLNTPAIIESSSRKVYGGANIESFMAMIEIRRPHDSKAESQFIRRWILPLGVEVDGFGNLHKRIDGDGDSILWTSHTDTVHTSPGRQAIRKKSDIVTLSPRAKSNCLGADDTAGIWLMREMILAGVPGSYIFHRAEEVGGLGSDYIATYEPERLKGIQAAIALDRKGFDSVITHQGPRCCSDKFGDSLMAALDLADSFKLDNTGLFTDTANYTDLVGECSNLSVGYLAQHSAKESQDLRFLCDLRTQLLSFDPSQIVIEREPGDQEKIEYESAYGFDPNLALNFDLESDWQDHAQGKRRDRFDSQDLGFIARAVRDYPDTAARILSDYGISLDELLDEIAADNPGDPVSLILDE